MNKDFFDVNYKDLKALFQGLLNGLLITCLVLAAGCLIIQNPAFFKDALNAKQVPLEALQRP